MSQLKIGLIGGSGLGEAVAARTSGVEHVIDTPFGPTSAKIIECDWDGVPVCFLPRHGEGHVLNPAAVPYRANIFALKKLGVTHIIASGAVGSLRDEFKPRDLVIPDQIIDKTDGRDKTFFERAAVHVEFAEPFCPVLRQILLDAAKGLPSDSNCNVHGRGCYVCMEGPAFSTRAESLMHRLWGGDLIGMTAMPEAKLAREAEIAYATVALVTDYDCWRNKPPDAAGKPVADGAKEALLAEIIGNLRAASDNAVALIGRAVRLLAEKADSLPASPAHDALRLAIWTPKEKISAGEVQRLAPLWIRYFGASGQ